MSYKIEKDMIKGLTQRALQTKSFVIAHDSGNPNNTGSNALQNEINYMKNNWNQPPSYAYTSHWVGGGGRIVQLAETGKHQNGAGSKANPHSVAHVELARTNKKSVFKKDYAAYVWLLRKLADDYGLPKTLDTGSSTASKGIKGHAWVSKHLGGTDHGDPYPYLASWGITKSQFKKDIEAKGDLTLSQYNKLVKRIQKLEKKVDNTNKNPTGSHKSGWNWLRRMGITNGKNPRGLVTRQSFATMLHRYDKKRFPKGSKPSKTHKKSWDKLKKSGITNGKNPGDVVTRQSFATMIDRYNKRGNKIKKK